MEEGFSGFCIKAHGNVVRGNGNGGGTGTKCGRWNPTTEQVKVLTDLFRSGLRTPSTDQIQKISTQLSFYGKIESKNVFYWFQNHKARERQKRRKVSMDENDFICSARSSDCNNISSSKRFFEVNDNNNNINNSHRHREHEVKAYEHERVIETLQLFPISSFDGNEHERVRFHAGECRETSSFSYTISAPEMDHPPLDLRLSFL